MAPDICLQCRRCGFDPWVGKIPLEKGMATHSSILAWRIPWTEESGGPQSMGSQIVGHNWVTHSLSLSQTCRDIKQRMRMKRNSITNIPAPTTPCGPLQFCPSSLFLRTISLPDIVYTMLLPFLCFYYQVQAYTAHPKRGQLIKRQVAGARYSDFAENSQKEKMVD